METTEVSGVSGWPRNQPDNRGSTRARVKQHTARGDDLPRCAPPPAPSRRGCRPAAGGRPQSQCPCWRPSRPSRATSTSWLPGEGDGARWDAVATARQAGRGAADETCGVRLAHQRPWVRQRAGETNTGLLLDRSCTAVEPRAGAPRGACHCGWLAPSVGRCFTARGAEHPPMRGGDAKENAEHPT